MTSSSSSNRVYGELKLPSDPVFSIGRDYIKEGKHDQAIDYFAGVLEQRSKDLGGDMLLGCASAWFEYGNSLLIKEEDAPSDGLLANAETAPKEDGDEDGDEDGEDKAAEVPDIEVPEEQEEKKEENGTKEQKDDEDDVNDLQIAWESLECARKIYEDHRNAELSDVTMEVLLPLSCVYLRLGDLQVTNNNFKDAFDDYKHALEIRQQLCNDYDRMLSDVYFSLALAYVYSSGSNTEKEPGQTVTAEEEAAIAAAALEAKKQASQYYILSKQVMDRWFVYQRERILQESNEELKTKYQSDLSNQQLIYEELQESIDGLNEEIASIEKEKQGPSKESTITTTIGFNPKNVSTTSGSSQMPQPMSTNDYFLQSSAIGATGSSDQMLTVNMLQPKKKTKPMTNGSAMKVDEKAIERDSKRPIVEDQENIHTQEPAAKKQKID